MLNTRTFSLLDQIMQGDLINLAINLESNNKQNKIDTIIYEKYGFVNRISDYSPITFLRVVQRKKIKPIKESKDFFDTISATTKMLSAELTWIEALRLVINIRKEFGNLFYGALFIPKNKNFIINPFHIITAYNIAQEPPREEKVKVVLYILEKNDLYNLTKDYDLFNASKIKIQSNLSTILNTLIETKNNINSDKDDKTFIEFFFKMDGNDKTINHFIITDQFNGNNILLVPNQIMSKGVFIPFYGISAITLDTNFTRGTWCNPFVSCNVSNGNENAIYNFINDNFDNEKQKINLNAVCTGSLSNKTIEGLSSLNHANLNSPYHRQNILPGAYKYAQAMIDFSIQIYKTAEII